MQSEIHPERKDIKVVMCEKEKAIIVLDILRK